MGDIFDDLVGGADEGPLGNAASAAANVSVLVVAEKAPTGQALHVEEAVFLKTAHVPQVIFDTVDSDTGEVVFGNELEFRKAMGAFAPVTVDAALAWCGERVGAVYDAHREEIDAANAGVMDAAPGANAVLRRAWMPHTTGRNRGQTRK
jgi:hypothetical protein